TTKITITVTVENGQPPVLTVENKVEINVGDTFDPKTAIISVSDDEDDLTVNDVTFTNDHDVNTAGVYAIIYSVTDSASNTTTARTVLVVNDGTIIVGSEYYILASNFVIRSSDVDTSDSAIIANAKAKAYKLEDLSEADVLIDSIGGYSSTEGIYNITFAVEQELTTQRTINAKVIDTDEIITGDEYSISAKKVTVGLSQAQAMIADDDELISATKAEAWRNDDYSASGTVLVKDKSLLEAKAGTYNVTFNVSEEIATETTVAVTVIDKDVVEVGDEYGIEANNLVMGVKDAEAISDNDELITKAQAKAWLVSNPAVESGSVELVSTTFTAAIGTYNAIFAVSEEPTTTVEISIEVKAEDHVTKGDQYTIYANDFTINTARAATITDAEIITKAIAKAELNSTKAEAGTIKVTDNTVIGQGAGTYLVELYVEEDPTAKTTITVTVSDGAAPTLEVTTPVEINVGETYDAKTAIEKVEDDKDTLTNDDVSVSDTYDVDVAGIYVVTYSVTDSDYNTTTAKSVLVVNDGSIVVGEEYVIQAYDFVINKPDVDTNSDAVILAAKAKAVKVTDGSDAEVEISSTGDYAAAKGTYAITFAVVEEPATTITINATVLDKDVIEVGDKYSIAANNVTVGLEEAQAMVADDAKIVSATAAEAWQTEAYANKGTVLVADKTLLEVKAGSYQVVLNVEEEPATSIEVTITVLDKDIVVIGDEYGIGANHITVGKDQAAAMVADNDELIAATEATAWKLSDNSEAGVLVDSTTLEAKAGEYKAVFSVNGEASTKAEVTITVIDKDVVETGDEYGIAANNITIGKAQAAAMTNETLITETAAKAWKLSDNSDANVQVESSEVQAIAGAYKVVFSVVEEDTTQVEVTVTVLDKDIVETGDEYGIAANNITIGKDQAAVMVADNDELIAATAATAWKLSDNSEAGVLVDSTTLEAKAGEYKAVFSVNGEASTKAEVTITVIDKDVVETGEEYGIAANNITIGKAQAAAIKTDEALIELTQAEAWKLSDDTEATVNVDSSTLIAKAGEYKVVFSVAEESATKAEVTITVLDKDIVETGDEYGIGANNVTIGVAQAAAIKTDAALIELTQAEAWKLSDNTEATVNVDSSTLIAKAGEYKAVFSVDEESATKVEVTITVLAKDIVETGDEYGIAANNITIGKAQAEQILADDAKLIATTQATAWKLVDDSEAGIVIDSNNLEAKAGDYKAIFSVAEEPATTAEITITVIDKDIVETGDEYGIGANNVTIGKAQAAAIKTDAALIDLTQAEAWKLSDNSEAGVSVDSSTLVAKAGTYTAVFSVTQERATKVEVTITVIDKDVVEIGEEYGIAANNVTMGKLQAAAITNDSALVNVTAAEAWKLSDNSEAGIKVESSELQAVKGEYKVVFSVVEEPATQVEVIITVLDKDIVEIGNEYGIAANNIVIGKTQAEAITTNANLIGITGARAWKLSDDSLATVKVESNALEAKAGEYKVKYSV
ncbi:DUF5011 domain-containing protein, partial [Erysipelotrichaceae bacterium OttesenSCG-928-M19]|nr:DUF5011 domain-containing protein [Erysipelotrichaceae bacterium OttesenSCG-928-M19]